MIALWFTVGFWQEANLWTINKQKETWNFCLVGTNRTLQCYLYVYQPFSTCEPYCSCKITAAMFETNKFQCGKVYVNATSAFVNRAFYVKFVESVKGFSVQYLSSEWDIIMYEQTRNKLQYTLQNPEKINLFLSWRIQPGEALWKLYLLSIFYGPSWTTTMNCSRLAW